MASWDLAVSIKNIGVWVGAVNQVSTFVEIAAICVVWVEIVAGKLLLVVQFLGFNFSQKLLRRGRVVLSLMVMLRIVAVAVV